MEFGRQIDLTHIDSGRRIQQHRRKVEDRDDPARDQNIEHTLGRAGRHRNHPDGRTGCIHTSGQLVERADPVTGDSCPNQMVCLVEKAAHLETSLGESGITGEGGAEVARSDDDDAAFFAQPQSPPNALVKRACVISDTPRPRRAEVGQILADLGAVAACHLGQGF